MRVMRAMACVDTSTLGCKIVSCFDLLWHVAQAVGKVQLQRLALQFSPAASLYWDLAAFDAANREGSMAADPTVVCG